MTKKITDYIDTFFTTLNSPALTKYDARIRVHTAYNATLKIFISNERIYDADLIKFEDPNGKISHLRELVSHINRKWRAVICCIAVQDPGIRKHITLSFMYSGYREFLREEDCVCEILLDGKSPTKLQVGKRLLVKRIRKLYAGVK